MSLTKLPLSMMADGTDGNIITYDASGNPAAVSTGSSGQVLTSAGAGSPPAFGAAPGATLSSEQATTSGSAVTFGSIPSGTKMIIIQLADVSTNGTGGCGITLGDAGGLETSGYNGRATIAEGGGTIKNFTDHFEFGFLNAGDVQHGQFICTLEDAANFTWVCTFLMGTSNAQNVWDGGGSKSLSAELTQVSLRTDDTFDAGAASILTFG